MTPVDIAAIFAGCIVAVLGIALLLIAVSDDKPKELFDDWDHFGWDECERCQRLYAEETEGEI